MTTNSLKQDAWTSLKFIAERLHAGRAALMVGSGFSKNASTSFPDWNELGHMLHERLHKQKIDKSSAINVPELAQEFCQRYDKGILEDFLREKMYDPQDAPSDLHVKILDLPWQDVFTTNYDTLLETASHNVNSRQYSVVYTSQDLPNCGHPRIVKLHGSFPSTRPFIITRQDYCRYPETHDPFITIVKSAFMENTLCLVGFSGTDPNFESWNAWLINNLGKDYAHRMYLIGLYNYSESQIEELEKKNIIPVNIAECFQSAPDDHSDPYIKDKGEYYRALEWLCVQLKGLIAELNSPRAVFRDDWPPPKKQISNQSRPQTKHDMIREIIADWKEVRTKYPGWCIAPESARNTLLTYTERYISYVTPGDDLPILVDLEFAYELNWRLEKCLRPIGREVALFEHLLHKYWPFQISTKCDSAQIIYDDPEYQAWEWDSVRNMWIEIALALLRYYREQGLYEKWHETERFLNEVYTHLTSEQRCALYYNRVLSSLFGMDIIEAKRWIAEWPVNTNLPFWEAKRAGLLAELGELNEAKKILNKSLADIAKEPSNRSENLDYSILSQEAYVVFVASALERTLRFFSPKKQEDLIDGDEESSKFSERLNKLKQYECDPWHEWQMFQARLERPPIVQPNERVKKEFDIGSRSRSIHFGTDDSEALTAYAFLRFCEEAGIPFRLRNATFASDIAKGTLRRIYEYSSYWAYASLARIGDEKTVDELFNRESLNIRTTAEVDSLLDWYLITLKSTHLNEPSEDKYCSGWYSIQLSRVLPEILSRLCCKCSLTAKNKLLLFLLEVYKDENKRRYKGIGRLFKRLLSSYSACQQIALLPQLLAFPILEQLDPLTAYEFHNPFTFLDNDLDTMEQAPMPALAEERIDEFLACANSQNPFKRKWAIFTLIRLYELDLISKGRILTFRDALYAQCDDFGFPKHTDFYKFAFFDLPCPDNLNLRNAFKRYISETSFPIQGDSRTFAMSSQDTIIFHELIHSISAIEWTTDEITKLFDRLLECWDTDKNHLVKKETPDFLSIRESFVYRFSMLTAVVSKVIAPALTKRASFNIKNDLERLISELNEYGIPSGRVQASCVHVFPNSKRKAIQEIENALHGSDSQQVINGLESILLILQQKGKNYTAKELDRLCTFVGQKIYWRHTVGLKSALNTISHLVKDFYERMGGELQGIVLQGLEHLANETSLSDGNAEWDFSDKLEIRQAAAHLSYLLHEKIIQKEMDIPNALKQWKNICSSENEFAEIRNQWLIPSE